MSYDAGLLQRCRDALDAAGMRPLRDKNVFGMRGLLLGKRMFAAVGDTSIIVRMRETELAAALRQPGVAAFTPGGQSLGTWVEVQGDVVADDPELRDWLDAGLRSLRTSA